jgi:ribosome biogenesis GTPase
MSGKHDKKKKIRLDFRQNIQNPARKGSAVWTKQLRDDKDSLDKESMIEAVKGKGSLAKKRTVDLHRAGEILELEEEADAPQGSESDWTPGTVISVHGQFFSVDDGIKVRNCVVRRILKSLVLYQHHPVSVGDVVDFTALGDDEGVIERVHERKGVLFRRYQHREHLIVSNVDQVLIVAAVVHPELRIHLVDRYIISAMVGGLKPIVVFNKIDLEHDEPLDIYESVYQKLNYPVVQTSVVTGDGIEMLRGILKDKKTTFAGVSGVGKTSLLNAIQPGLNLTTRPVNKTTSRGVHTTTSVQLLKLDFGGFIVDTPGIRQFALFKINRAEVANYFDDFEPFRGKCKYPNCSHIHEPGCAILSAVEEELIAPWRYDSYLKIYNDQEEFLESWEK